MSVRIGINGFGRIGRYMTRLLAADPDLTLVAVNARAENSALVHLLKYDSVHGRLSESATPTEDGFELAGKPVAVTRKPAGEWIWGDLGVDIVLETTGKFTSREPCQQHLDQGARKVLIAAPGKGADATIVMGVNDQIYQPEKHHIVSNASCTTNCLAPVAKVVHDHFGIEQGLMTTIHSYTMSQRILDGSHKDLRRGRAAAMSMLPTTTGAARAVTQVLPELQGRLDGMAVRVPTPNVSLVDFVVDLAKDADAEALNKALRDAAEGPLRNVLGYTEEPLVSIDFNGSTYGGVVDGPCTTVLRDKLAKIIIWYDNESGFSNQLLRLTKMVAKGLA